MSEHHWLMNRTYKDKRILVTGAGGFIGGWLTRDLLNMEPKSIRAVDIKSINTWYQQFNDVENLSLDLRDSYSCKQVMKDVDIVFNLAADMGGMGFIENNKAQCMLSVLINSNLLYQGLESSVSKYFFASSACVYNQSIQRHSGHRGLKEEDAYPADPEDGYGWEKLFSERMCRHFSEDFGLTTRVARFHNVYGPHGTYKGGREKAPAAICRKVAEAVINNSNEIEIWGDGTQIRSYMFIDDCLEGIHRIMNGNSSAPVNLGSSESVTVNELVEIVSSIAGVTLSRKYDLSAPKGVPGRNSDNSLIRELYNWEPGVTLRDGLEKTYSWIFNEMLAEKV